MQAYGGRLRKSDYFVKSVPLAVCRRLVEQYHYAGHGSSTATFRHGLFHISDALTCLGTAWWAPPTRGAAEATWDGDPLEVLGLSRLAISPDVPKNAASFLIAGSIKLIRLDGRWRCLVTYADTWQGHTGSIYRATNWEYMGEVMGEPTFIDQAGRLRVRQGNMGIGKGRTVAEMSALGYERVGRFPKHKFRMVLPEPRQKAPRMQYTLEFEIA